MEVLLFSLTFHSFPHTIVPPTVITQYCLYLFITGVFQNYTFFKNIYITQIANVIICVYFISTLDVMVVDTQQISFKNLFANLRANMYINNWQVIDTFIFHSPLVWKITNFFLILLPLKLQKMGLVLCNINFIIENTSTEKYSSLQSVVQNHSKKIVYKMILSKCCGFFVIFSL